jgi:DNA-binding NarL/FixJ family response regulator
MPLSVVVVDDDPEYRMIVRFLLAAVAEEMTLVGEAADGAEALSLVLRERPDVLVSDLVMPHLNGIELTRRVREALPDTKIILMSSYTDDAYRMMASSSRADAFVSKQVINSSLVSAIRDLTGRQISGGSGPGSAGASSSPAVPLN